MYVGEGKLQWFLEPVPLGNVGADSFKIDLTYREAKPPIPVIVNLTWAYSEKPHSIPSFAIQTKNGTKVTLDKVEILFVDNTSKSVRYTAQISTEAMWILLKSDPILLEVDSEDHTLAVPISETFLNRLTQLRLELS